MKTHKILIEKWRWRHRRRVLTQVDQEVPFYRVQRTLKVVEILTCGWGKEKEGEEELRFRKNIRGTRMSSFPLSSPLWTEYSFRRRRPQPPPSPSWSSRLSDRISQPSLYDSLPFGTLKICLNLKLCLWGVWPMLLSWYFSNLKLFY